MPKYEHHRLQALEAIARAEGSLEKLQDGLGLSGAGIVREVRIRLSEARRYLLTKRLVDLVDAADSYAPEPPRCIRCGVLSGLQLCRACDENERIDALTGGREW